MSFAACNSDGTTTRSAGLTGCRATSWVAGTTELCGGHLIYRDYVYDDYGADSGLPSFPPIEAGSLAPAAGDERYPAGEETTADLVRFELALAGAEVHVEFELNTLYEANQTIAALAIDTDGDSTTGGGAWPGLGISSGGWDVLHAFDEGDPGTNLISGSFPRPPGDSWRIWAVTARANGTVMNVAFRGPDEEAAARGFPSKGSFWEDRQSAALGAGDVTAFSTVVDVADLERGVSRTMGVEPGFHQRVYTSRYTLSPGEGVSLEGVPGRHGDTGNVCEQYFHYLGKYQPYGIYLPRQPGPHGLQLVLHGCSANHASLINQPGMQQRFGEDLNRILVVPLGRGPVGFYSDLSERDVLDVMADVAASYEIDADEVVSGGYSMGGYGAMRFAALYPDVFAAAANWVGFTGDAFNLPIPGNPLPPMTGSGGSRVGAVGNVIDFVGNLRNIPIVNLYSGADELVLVTMALALQQRLSEVEVEHDFYLHPVAEHLTYALLDDWAKEADFTAGRRLVRRPQRVTFRTDPALDFPEYEISHDRAHWVRDIRGRAPGYVDVDVVSRGCGRPEPTYQLGTDLGLGPLPLVWTRQFRRLVGEVATARESRIEAVLANVASFAIDPGGACLGVDPIAYRVATDGPVRIDLTDGRSLSLGAGTHEGAF